MDYGTLNGKGCKYYDQSKDSSGKGILSYPDGFIQLQGPCVWRERQKNKNQRSLRKAR